MANLLVVEDDKQIRHGLQDILGGEHHYHMAETAEEGLTCLDTFEYDVMLVDISLPGMSGLEFFGMARQRHPDLPVIIISAIGDQDQIRGLMRMGAYDYLVKPFEAGDLRRSLDGALKYRQMLREAQSTDGQGEHN